MEQELQSIEAEVETALASYAINTVQEAYERAKAFRESLSPDVPENTKARAKMAETRLFGRLFSLENNY